MQSVLRFSKAGSQYITHQCFKECYCISFYILWRGNEICRHNAAQSPTGGAVTYRGKQLPASIKFLRLGKGAFIAKRDVIYLLMKRFQRQMSNEEVLLTSSFQKQEKQTL